METFCKHFGTGVRTNRVKPCRKERRQALIFKGLPPNYLIIRCLNPYSMAACAAATRAMGTRKGEQLT